MVWSSKKNSYRQSLKQALRDHFLQDTLENFRKSYAVSRENAFFEDDFENKIAKISEIKNRSVSKLTELFFQFKDNAEKLGVNVHLAKSANEANEIIENIAYEFNVRSVVKAKSMTSEEIFLNKHLESKGFEVTETDLGEWIIQLRKERPSHMVLPAIHLSRGQVAKLFSEITGEILDDRIQNLVKVARNKLRNSFFHSEMGITGANFAVARTGTIGLVTNEGNARLVTSFPKVHVALIGLEKLVETVDDALHIIDVLPKNATGQKVTSYVTWITGKNECLVNEDKKKSYHIVFLDNGRKKIARDPIFSEILNCIRCGACANVCPIYNNVGGHNMGHVYIGPVGYILTYFYHGIDKVRFLADNCINCLACRDVCASKINLPLLISEIQTIINEEKGQPIVSKLIGYIVSQRKIFHLIMRLARIVQVPFTSKDGFIRYLPLFLYKNHAFKSIPKLSAKSFRSKWEKIKPVVEKPRLRVGIMAGCLNDFVYPEQLESILELFAEYKIELFFPNKQGCCGLPVNMMGDKRNARLVALQNVEAFREGDYDVILTLCASCASFIKSFYPKFNGLSAKESVELSKFVSKIIDLRTFINIYLNLSKKTKNNNKVTYHAPCHMKRGLDIKESPKELIENAGYNFIKDDREDNCCGFGGTYSLKFPEISESQLKKKVVSAVDTGADTLVTECPGCVMQLRGGIDKLGVNLKVMHLSEILRSHHHNDIVNK